MKRMKPTKIFYDASFAVNKYRGMGVYINAVKKIIAENNSIEIKGLSCYDTPDTTVQKFGFSIYPLWEQISFPLFLKNAKPDVVIFPYNTMPWFTSNSYKKILILHDVIFLEKSDNKNFTIKQLFGKYYRRALVKRAYKQADVVITVSEFSKSKIIEYLGDKSPFYVIPNVINAALLSSSDTEAVYHGKPYILNVGGEAPTKNIFNLIKAYAALPEGIRGLYDLRLVGKYSDSYIQKVHYYLTQKNIPTSNIIFLGFVTNDELCTWYKHCSAFVFPSLQEGFGIPIIEAMTFKKPLLVSNASCLPEIAGEGAVYFNPEDSNDIAAKIKLVLEDKLLPDNYIQAYNHQLKKYSNGEFERKVIEFITKEISVL